MARRGDAWGLALVEELAATPPFRLRRIPSWDSGHLTPTETRVLEQTARGLRGAQVAILLGMAEPTVKHHLSAIRYKLRARTTAEAVAVAVRAGLIA